MVKKNKKKNATRLFRRNQGGCAAAKSRHRDCSQPFTRRGRRTHYNQPASGAFLRGIWPFPGGDKSVSILDALRSDGLDAMARRLRGKASIEEFRSLAGYGGVPRA